MNETLIDKTKIKDMDLQQATTGLLHHLTQLVWIDSRIKHVDEEMQMLYGELRHKEANEVSCYSLRLQQLGRTDLVLNLPTQILYGDSK